MANKSAYMLTSLLTISLSGCIQIGAGYYPISSKVSAVETNKLESPYTGVLGTSVLPSKRECSAYIHENLKSFSTKEELLKYWGPPDKKERNGASERFIYDGSLQFSGVYAVVMIVPVPLVFPSQRKHCIVEMKNGLITRLVKVEQADDFGYACGGYFFQEAGSNYAFGCGTDKWDGNHRKSKAK